MTRLTDGNKTVEITMQTWTGNGYTPDFSNDFFEVGGLERDEEKDAYIVPDVDYCVDYANDWKNNRFDFADSEESAESKLIEIKLIQGDDKMSKRYLVIREQGGTLEDVHAEVYESLEDANNNAKYNWNHLTDAEQKKNHVFVAEVTDSDLYDDAIEDGEVIDWTAYKQYNTPESGFDSDKQ